MTEHARPQCEADVVDLLADAIRDDARVAIVGGESKRDIGRTVDAWVLSLAGLTGIVDYDPAELVLTVRAGTPLAIVEALVAGERQMLAFEPFDHGPIFGRPAGAATVGGVVATGTAGSRRVSAGGARDHLLGFRGVSGRGEPIVAGARVVKNVTGYDLPKLAAGSWGRLFALTELTLKVMPRPETSATYFVRGLGAAAAVRAMAAVMGSQAEVAATAHVPGARAGDSMTAVRIEGFPPSVRARGAMLDSLLAAHGPTQRAEEGEADAFWSAVRLLTPLPVERPLWKIVVAPGRSVALIDALSPDAVDWLLDWAGGLLWVATETPADRIRAMAARAGGHATLVRASATMRAAVPVFQPPASGLAALEERVRRAFDPAGLFETGRF